MAANIGCLEFVAGAVLAHLRSGRRPTETEAVELTRLPVVAGLRAGIEPKDKDWVVALVSESGNKAKLGVALIKNLAKNNDVQDLLRARFDAADATLRSWLFWKILDDPKLPQEWHQRLFKFAIDEWDIFRVATLDHFGTPDQVRPLALGRIADASIPPSKQWANLLCLIVAPDQAAAKAVILLCRASWNDFGKSVADELLEKFFGR